MAAHDLAALVINPKCVFQEMALHAGCVLLGLLPSPNLTCLLALTCVAFFLCLRNGTL